MIEKFGSGGINYFAYGSNLHPVRIRRRINPISLIGTARLSGYRLKFNKRGKDGSAKCTIEKTGLSEDFVQGVIYEIDAAGLKILDQIEGLNEGYCHQLLRLHVNGRSMDALTYVAMSEFVQDELRPFEWYKQLVLEGMWYHVFDEVYVSQVKEMAAMPDVDLERNSKMMDILNEIRM